MPTQRGEQRSSTRQMQYLVDEAMAGQRLDRIVAALRPDLSRAAASRLIAEQAVLINGLPGKAASRPVAGATLTVLWKEPPPTTAQPEDIPLEILYEDADLVAVNKQPGMVVHPAPGNEHGTLVNALLGRYRQLPGDETRPGVVHRLDKDTSGVIVVARTSQALAALAGAFKRREVQKEYLALVLGTLQPAEGMIDAAIGRDPRYRQRMAVVATQGRAAQTAYRTEERFAGFSLVRVFPTSGRMHQIRVHFSAARHPIAGDPVYGQAVRGLPLRRQFLHAERLRIRHPHTGDWLDLHAPLPADLQRVLQILRGSAAS
jgi:23S rRNA pseudouridine1911/1915/1917 synthase